jgi:hypothetical protein
MVSAMDKIPFTVYDFFGYLSSGFVVLISILVAFVGYKPLLTAPSLLVSILLIVLSYIAGHVVANIAGDILESRIVRGRLGMPTEALMGSGKPSRVGKVVFRSYYSSLPASVITRVKQRARKNGVTDHGEALFLHCHAVLKSDPTVQSRLSTFLNLYGFCRNMTIALVLAAIFLGIGILADTAETGLGIGPGWWIAAALACSCGLFFRYLKFLRQYSVELLTTYAEVTNGSD